ncbi:MFS transporter [Paenactinomyces guangxiensis]|uniref:MFS transporter n=1 Tax=Paenactinomyces guangxiensis TaxID=1490290 RepID=A0A7W1WS05_9BACL|nr:MFS transporter [Paenactinomyces guangxiensis]MBA4494978.1 MFS transporter [Paenactinomyces guangxiensis]MBH8592061.1 MFS transporter [Paenactinomyces guangxiensis]
MSSATVATAEQQGSPKLSALITLSSIPLIMVLGNSMLIPVLPKASSVLGVTSFQVSLLITLFSIPAAIIIPIAGILSDRIGRKKVIFFSLLLYGLGGLLAGFASIWKGGSYSLLLASRIIQGIGAAGTAPIAMVLVSDLYKKESRSKALGIIEASNAMGKVLSPILGSLIALITWYAMFFVFPVFTIPAAIALWFLIKEPTAKKEPPPLDEYIGHIKKIFQRQGKWMMVTFLAGAITMFTMFGVLFYLSNFLEQAYKIGGVIKGFVLAIPLLALCGTAYFTGSHVKEKTNQMRRLTLIGLIILALTVGIVPWLKQPVILISVTFLMGIGSGLILPCLNTLITSAVGLQERGIITSLYSSVRFFGVALGPPVFGALENRPFLLFIGTAVAVTLVVFLSLVFIQRPQRLRGKDGRSRLLIRKRRLHPA